jgi:hypothetical protein
MIKIIWMQRRDDEYHQDDRDEMIKIIRMQRWDDVRSDERDEMIKIILMQRWDDEYQRDDRD